MLSKTILLFISTFLPLFATAQQCYGLDGSKLGSTYTACAPSSQDAKHSSCCADGDICLANGLCMATKSEYMGTMWQSGCTDPTGQDESCPQQCPTENTFPKPRILTPEWNIQACEVGTYCCRTATDRRSCCANATAPRVTSTALAAFPARLLETPAPSLSPSTSATPSPTPAPTPAPTCAAEKRTTAVLGGVLGSLFGLVLLGATAAVVWYRAKEQRQRRLKEHYEEQFAQTGASLRAVAASEASIRNGESGELVTMEEFGGKE